MEFRSGFLSLIAGLAFVAAHSRSDAAAFYRVFDNRKNGDLAVESPSDAIALLSAQEEGSPFADDPVVPEVDEPPLATTPPQPGQLSPPAPQPIPKPEPQPLSPEYAEPQQPAIPPMFDYPHASEGNAINASECDRDQAFKGKGCTKGGCGKGGAWAGWILPGAAAWDGSIIGGVNGASGNSENIDILAAVAANRAAGAGTVSFTLDYYYANNGTAVTDHKLYSLSRYEEPLSENIRWFADFWYEWDEFKSFDSRIGVHGGLAFTLLDDGTTKLVSRVGAGAAREFGGTNNAWTPELLLGVDYERQISHHQKVVVSADYFPDIEDLSLLRLNLRATYELLIQEEHQISLIVTAFDRFDNSLGAGPKDNDIDYSLALKKEF